MSIILNQDSFQVLKDDKEEMQVTKNALSPSSLTPLSQEVAMIAENNNIEEEIVCQLSGSFGFGAEVQFEDPVNHPSHYTQGNIEVVDFIIDQDLPYLIGNVVKYICRYRFKGKPIEDLKKARFYLDRQIEELEKDGFEE